MKSRYFLIGLFLIVASFALGFSLGERKSKTVYQQVAPAPEIVAQALNDLEGDFLLSTGTGFEPLTKKHMVLQLWYYTQAQATGLLCADTEKDFGPIKATRSPYTILEEQRDFFREWLPELDRLNQEANPLPYGIREGPPETARDPTGDARIDWEDYLDEKERDQWRRIWIGKSARNKEWFAWEAGKGVYQPDQNLLDRIEAHIKS
ncbi:hypothetical protein AAFN60_18435 [Roseibacillus persicicus]|uniref:hypothetical protein n=1 Tax=Roseibacillus persicicus TaxID=454148 RepID=UPI00398B2A23